MKKFIILASVAATLALTACTKKDETATAPVDAAPAATAPAEAPAPAEAAPTPAGH